MFCLQVLHDVRSIYLVHYLCDEENSVLCWLHSSCDHAAFTLYLLYVQWRHVKPPVCDGKGPLCTMVRLLCDVNEP